MSKIKSTEQKIEILFKYLATKTSGFPQRGGLSNVLNDIVSVAIKGDLDIIKIPPKISSLFVSAAVESWHRGIHSFLISLSLTNVSPIWSSVSGYYASHYCIKGFAHLLGYFLLYKKKKTIKIDIDDGIHYCHINKKGANDREHKYYWKILNNNSRFNDDPYFTPNNEDSGDSDVAHRNIANYLDFVIMYPNFNPLKEENIIQRIDKISKMELTAVPIPRVDKFPDVDYVQLVAYHRIVKFRKYLDDILGGANKYWTKHRNPTWVKDYINFQIIKSREIEFGTG